MLAPAIPVAPGGPAAQGSAAQPIHSLRRLRPLIAVVLVAAAAFLVTWLFRRAMLDDAYITYRVAQHLAQGHGFVYNLGEQTLTTTAPGYALVLTPLTLAGPHFPTLALLLSALSLAAAAWLLADLGGGLAGAILLLTSPLLLGALGMETTTQVAFVLLGLRCARRNRPAGMALALAAAAMVRPDGILPATLVGLAYVLWWRRLPVLAIAIGALPVAVIYGWLWHAYGSPLPVTLAAKVAQRSLGFYGYLEGMRVWASEMAALSHVSPWWLAPLPPLCALGLALSFLPHYRWNLALVAWAVLHSAAYVALDVAGYAWYYAPIAVAVASTAGVGLMGTARLLLAKREEGEPHPLSPSPCGGGGRPALGAKQPHQRSERRQPAFAWRAALIACLSVASLSVALAQARVSLALAASLPDPRTALYVHAGDWLASHSAPGATIGVMEVGIMGYFSQRTMIDFAGLTRPQTAQALARGDIFWSIAHYQPDYLVLSNTDPLYSYDIQDDPWFQATYHTVTAFRDSRWYGSPLTIFERRAVPPAGPVAVQVGSRYGAVAILTRYALDRTVARPGQFIHVSAEWQRGSTPSGTWKLFAHLIDDHFKVYSGNDVAVYPLRWPRDSGVETNQFVAVPADLPAGKYYVEIGWYDPVTLQRLPVTDASGKRAGESVVLHPITVAP